MRYFDFSFSRNFYDALARWHISDFKFVWARHTLGVHYRQKLICNARLFRHDRIRLLDAHDAADLMAGLNFNIFDAEHVAPMLP